MSNITDKELLAICNLTNLKLEFANLKNKLGNTDVVENHTIYSLLDQEYRSIMSDEPKSRAFYDLENEDNPDNPSIPLYTDVLDLKKKAGIVFEYYEKYRDHWKGKSDREAEGKFLEEWKILYAGDGYKIMS